MSVIIFIGLFSIYLALLFAILIGDFADKDKRMNPSKPLFDSPPVESEDVVRTIKDNQ